METMATPPLSSSSSSASSPSPSFQGPDDSGNQAPEGTFDFSDPDTLELLLQTINVHSLESSSDSQSSEEYSQVSSWGALEGKASDMNSTFDFPFSMDFEPNLAVDPSTLHYNTSIFTQPNAPDNSFYMDYPAAMDMDFGPILPHDSNQWTQLHTEPGTGRRLSITSSSSSSGASLSPILEASSTSASSPRSDYSPSESDPAAELAHRVRQAAGVTLAVPVSKQVQQLAAAGGQTKLPIPRLPRASPQTPVLKRAYSTKSVSPVPEPSPVASPAASTPSESSDSSSQNTSQSQESIPSATTVLGRPKTSHTTIERRYRTNLNARITGLKHAVPALRVLEVKDGNSPWNDVVDSRGFVDGVKVARKMSKANVLGKATEYIRVLKKREARLKREQDGLKSVLSGLVGGPALLKEWEREWRERFGGEEKDEVEGDDAASPSDDEDGDGEDSDGEEDEGRARKKMKVAKAPKKEKTMKVTAPPPTAPVVPGIVPEKRKRGRPRKVPLPPAVPAMSTSPIQLSAEAPAAVSATPSDPVLPMAQDFLSNTHSNAQATPQYLLAAFAFFSVWNSPFASSYTRPHTQDHTHHGTVLTQPTMIPTNTAPVPAHSYGVHSMVQAFHLLVSTAVFFYIVFPWLSGVLRQNGLVQAAVRRLQLFSTGQKAAASPNPNPRAVECQRAALMDALAPSIRGQPDEADKLRKALGVSTGLFGLLQSIIKAARVDRGLEMNQLEQRAWTRLGELVACDDTVSRTTRLQIFWCMSWHVSTFATSTPDLATLAFIILPVSRSKATELWGRARKQEVLRPYEKIVLANLSVEEAAELLSKWHRWHDSERHGRCAACEKRTPLGVLAAIMIRDCLRKHAAAMFVRTVVAKDDCEGDESEEDIEQENKERKEIITAGKSIGGRTAQLATILERIWETGFCAHEEVIVSRPGNVQSYVDEDTQCEDEHDLASTDEAEIRCLLSTTLLYRRIFPGAVSACATAVSVILSPPPSPSRKNLALHMSLRAALASPAFDSADERLADTKLSAALDQARDRVNDLLTAVDRSVRRNTRL